MALLERLPAPGHCEAAVDFYSWRGPVPSPPVRNRDTVKRPVPEKDDILISIIMKIRIGTELSRFGPPLPRASRTGKKG